MTTNFRIRKPTFRTRVQQARREMTRWPYYGNKLFQLPTMSKKEALALKHGDIVYRGVVMNESVQVTAYKVLGRPGTLAAFGPKGRAILRELQATSRAVHQSDKYVDRDKTALRIPVQPIHSYFGCHFNLPVWSRDKQIIEASVAQEYAIYRSPIREVYGPVPVCRSLKDVLANVHTRKGTEQSVLGGGELKYFDDLTAGYRFSFSVTSERQMLRIVRSLLTTKWGARIMRERAAELEADRHMEREMDYHYDDLDDMYYDVQPHDAREEGGAAHADSLVDEEWRERDLRIIAENDAAAVEESDHIAGFCQCERCNDEVRIIDRDAAEDEPGSDNSIGTRGLAALIRAENEGDYQ